MSAVLGVVVGLAFMVLMLSLLASAAVEGIAGFLRLRAGMLERALHGLLVGGWQWEQRKKRAGERPPLAKAVLEDPTLAAGSPETPGKRFRPSYMSRDQFVDLVFKHYLGNVSPSHGEVRSAIAGHGVEHGMEQLLARFWEDAGGQVDVLRHRLGHHYDDTMNRVSGWYRRRTRWMLFGAGVVLAVGFNVGLLSMARALWVDDAVRARLTEIARDAPTASSGVTGDLANAGTELRRVADDGLPIGWGNRAAPSGAGGWIAAAVGWLAVGVGVSFGAPFWFDVLGRFVNLRLAGPAPARRTAGVPAGDGAVVDPAPVAVPDATRGPGPTAGPVMTAFDPAVHGFHFDNDFVNKVPVPFHAMRLTTYGRCGGMVYAGLDLYRTGQVVPDVHDLPAKESPLGKYLLKRLFDSWANASALRFLTWTLDDDLTVARHTRDELAALYALIDRGEPAPLGLVSSREPADIGHCHQVLAVGYERRDDGNVVVYTWDNNEADTMVTLTVPAAGVGVASSRRANPYRGFFVHSYTQQTPPTDLSPIA